MACSVQSLGSTISTDESSERRGEWVGQPGDRTQRYKLTKTHMDVENLMEMECHNKKMLFLDLHGCFALHLTF